MIGFVLPRLCKPLSLSYLTHLVMYVEGCPYLYNVSISMLSHYISTKEIGHKLLDGK